MLKIEKLQPKDNAFTLEDHAEHGVALLKVKNESFTGEYHLHEVGTATVAGVGVAAKRDAALSGITLDNTALTNINLTLTKKVVRSFKVEASDSAQTIEVPDLWVTAVTKKSGTKSVTFVDEHHLEVAAESPEETYVLELTVLVATGVAADDDVASDQTLTLEAGETSAQDVHINILSNLRVNPGTKPNLTHFSVRGAKLHF